MSDPASARRFICRACGRAHAIWAPRCSGCLSLEGLAKDAGPDATVPVAPRPVEPVATALPEMQPAVAQEPARVRLEIVRDDHHRPAAIDAVGAEESAPTLLLDVEASEYERDSTGLSPLDHALGGGLVAASVVLLAAVPGCGKSSLTLQMLDGLGHRCLYVTGEETEEQIAMTARRLGVSSREIRVLVEQRLTKIFAKARMAGAQTIVIDSIQKMRCDDVSARIGSPTQLKECAARLVKYAKDTGTAIWIIGHVTSDGDIAGPRTIEHDVDAVLELEQGPGSDGTERILRVAKNRFGPTNIVGRFLMTPTGLVPDPRQDRIEDDQDYDQGTPPRTEARMDRMLGAGLYIEGDEGAEGAEIPDTILNRLLRASVRMTDVTDTEEGASILEHAQRFNVATEELHAAALAYARGIPDPIRKKLLR